MADFAVIADLPLGAYRARTPGGHLDPAPSPARLHSALLCAAAAGPRAIDSGDNLEPADEDAEALGWLEAHPPDGVRLPRTTEVRSSTYGYRREGTLVSEGGSKPFDKVVARAMVGLVAVDGSFAWTWSEPPPPSVCVSLAALCSDVAHLGSADTPVRMRLGEAVPTHRRDPAADLFIGQPGLDLDIPMAGRTEALRMAYEQTRRPATGRQDAWSPNTDQARTSDYVQAGREPARYVTITPGTAPWAPWSTVLLAGLSGDLRPDQHVGWATGVHRALISLVGDGAPAVLTGSYLPGARPPANRVAIQLLDRDAARRAGLEHDGPALAVLLPDGAAPGELALVADAFSLLRRVTWGPQSRQLCALPARSGSEFWPRASGPTVFDVRPAAVPDTRPLGRTWTIADALALSLGFVLRGRPGLTGEGRGDARHRDTALRVRAAGLHVRAVERVMDGDLTRYVHRIDASRVVQPYRARLQLGGLLDDRSLVCLGQSRHLGGGLLVPTDEQG